MLYMCYTFQVTSLGVAIKLFKRSMVRVYAIVVRISGVWLGDLQHRSWKTSHMEINYMRRPSNLYCCC